MSGIGLYVHIPFCASRCPYCDFATAPARHALRTRYLEALATEIAREGDALGRPRVRTLYVGGGTPSLLEPEEIAALAGSLRSAFDLRPREVTVEANPATLDRPRLHAWHALGATRLSIGAQTFSERGLAALGRTHRAADVAPAVEAARSLGLDVNLDLIFGWPGQTTAEWAADLAAAIALSPDHVSAYPLELALEPEEGISNWPGGGWATLARWRGDAAAAQPDDRGLAVMYRMAERRLADARYRHYEIANWARAGKRSLHNLGYWRNEEWLGVGVGAHSHLGGLRSRNAGSMHDYLARISSGAPRVRDDAAVPAADAAMLALRLDRGLDLRRYGRRFGDDARARVRAALATLDGTGLVAVAGDRARLTPRGRFLANEVMVRLLPD